MKRSRLQYRYAFVVQDLASHWIQNCPCNTKTSQETVKSLRKFLAQEEDRKVVYTDNSLELVKTCKDLFWNHCTSTPHRSETNGIAERAVRRVNEGTSTVLVESGLDEHWWAGVMECYCSLRNVQDLLADEKPPSERRFGEHFARPIIPFGAQLNIIQSLLKTKRGFINSARKSSQTSSWDMRYMRGEAGEETYGLQT